MRMKAYWIEIEHICFQGQIYFPDYVKSISDYSGNAIAAGSRYLMPASFIQLDFHLTDHECYTPCLPSTYTKTPKHAQNI